MDLKINFSSYLRKYDAISGQKKVYFSNKFRFGGNTIYIFYLPLLSRFPPHTHSESSNIVSNLLDVLPDYTAVQQACSCTS